MITSVINQRLFLLAALTLALSSPAQSLSATKLPDHQLLAAGLESAGAQSSGAQSAPSSTAAPSQLQVGLLSSSSTEKLLPNAILFKGQLAPVQARNSGAIRHPDGSLTVASLVDNSGYSSGVRERFQFFLYTETPLQLAPNKVLASGFYGAGFLADNTMVVLDVAGRDVMIVPTTADSSLQRPRPLQVLSAPSSGEPRLYLGKSYIILRTNP